MPRGRLQARSVAHLTYLGREPSTCATDARSGGFGGRSRPAEGTNRWNGRLAHPQGRVPIVTSQPHPSGAAFWTSVAAPLGRGSPLTFLENQLLGQGTVIVQLASATPKFELAAASLG